MISKQTVLWSAIGVAAVALVTASVVIALPSVERTATPATTAPTTTTEPPFSEPADPSPKPDALAVANQVADAVARVDDAALQPLLCAGATPRAKAPLAYQPGGLLVGARQTRNIELVTTIRVTLRLDVVAVVQEQKADDWCLVNLITCPLTETGEFDTRTALESWDITSREECDERPLRIE